jgi:membrane associated rhomboid family serine protease
VQTGHPPLCSTSFPRELPCVRVGARMAASKSTSKPTAVFALILANLALFVVDKLLRMPFARTLYLYHGRMAWWQPFTACFCHADRAHLSGNLFLLLLFGRSVEDDLGWGGLLVAFAWCGVLANLASLVLLPAGTVSIGASGAVFGLFAVSVLSRLTPRDLDWRKLVEVCVLGEFVLGKMLSEVRTAATGGIAGVNHVAHLSGAGAGVLLVFILRTLLGAMERGEASKRPAV